MSILTVSNWRIPKNWKIVSIGEVSLDWRGGAPLEPEDFTERGFPILHKGAIQRGGKILIDNKKKTYTTEKYAQSHQKSVIDKSYLAVTLRDLVPTGPSIGLIADLAHASSPQYLLAQGAYGFQVDKDRIEPSYLVHLSNYNLFRGYMKRYCVGSTQIHIRTPVFLELEIPLPTLGEQKRIAAILDKANALREKRRQAIAKLDMLLQSAFVDMFGDGKISYFANAFSSKHSHQKGWPWVKLTNVARLATGHTPSRKVPDYWGGDIPWISLTDIRLLDGKVAHVTSEYTNAEGIRKSSAVKLPTETVCFSRTASVGFVTMMGCEMATSQDFVNWICSKELNPFYLMWSLIYSRNQLRASSTGSIHKTIYFPTVQEFHVLLPPLRLQNQFAKLAKHLATVKAKNENALEYSNRLFQSLQQRAFNGELFNNEAEELKAFAEASANV